MDGAVLDGQLRADPDRRVESVQFGGVTVSTLRKGANGRLDGVPGSSDDVVADCLDVLESEFREHGDQATGTFVVAGHHGVEVALHVGRVADVRAQEPHEVLVDHALARQVHDRDVDPLFVALSGVGSESPPAHVDDMAGVCEKTDGTAAMEGRRHHGDVVVVADRQPRVVGDEDVSGPHGVDGKRVEKVLDADGHGVHVPGRAGHRLRDHPAPPVEDPRRQVAALADRLAERRPDDGLRLLLDCRDQTAPDHLVANLVPLGHGVFPFMPDS